MRISFDEVKQTLRQVLSERGVPGPFAEKVAHEMARNSLEGTYTHGINRFPRLIRYLDDGIIDVAATPMLEAGFGAIERYDGRRGFGITNAWASMERAVELAGKHGIGLVALRNTNHWMRAATYGYLACDEGMAALCFANTMPNMPAWGAVDARMGNNPLVLAFPREGGHLLVDMAMTQFSYGALELALLQGRQMPFDAGYGPDGEITRDPEAVLKTQRLLPTGYWKGAGLSMLLDTFAGCMSMGNMVAGVGKLNAETGVSQLFIAINHRAIVPAADAEAILEDAIADLLRSERMEGVKRIVYPGLRAVETRAENEALGIPVDERVWKEVQGL